MRFCLIFAAWLLGGVAALAAQSAPVTDARGTATLVTAQDSVAVGQPVRVGLLLALAPGWHTYGADPGDAGAPPELDWTLPAGVTAGAIEFPPAHTLTEGMLTTRGYIGTVLLPTSLRGAQGPLPIRLEAHWLVCSNICVPASARLALNLPAGDGAPGPQARLFDAGRPAALPAAAVSGWGAALLLAFAGGLVLNLMPCVFPLLAMKAAALATLCEAPARGRLAHAAAYAAGVVLTFCGLGVLLLVLRGGGTAGWGFQFAHPGFLLAIAWLLFAVGLNFSGVFEASAMGLAGRGGLPGSFATGLLAVLVASPCTAPFMGTALAVALAAPPLPALAIFALLGLGLAAPYVLLAALPGFARALPRPGAWMEVLRNLLAFPIYAAACWLLWVLAQEAGADGVLACALGCLLIGFAAWAVGRRQRGGGRVWGVAGIVALLLLVGGGTLGIGRLHEPGGAADRADAFSPERLAALRAAGRPVFVDMTASWCVTCLLNERLALDRVAVRRAFQAADVAVLRGDWTRQDAGLTAFLHAHDSAGVPLYLFYPRAAAAPVRLPQILTEDALIGVLRREPG
jgi:thiol:disulfide interchange protein DsbD